MNTAVIVLWVYIAFLELGGVMGFVKAKSKASLIASTAFALPLVLCALGVIPFKYHLWILAFLVVFFGMRFAKSKKMMPNGMMATATLVALVAIQALTR
jgi:uncharacterized membrane protein (UPF0136 family)